MGAVERQADRVLARARLEHDRGGAGPERAEAPAHRLRGALQVQHVRVVGDAQQADGPGAQGGRARRVGGGAGLGDRGERLAERDPQRAPVGVARLRELGQATEDDLLERRRHAGVLGRTPGPARQVRLPLLARRALERRRPGHELEEDRARRVDVGAGVRRVAADLLRGHVRRRPGRSARRRVLRRDRLRAVRQPEVHQPRAAGLHEHVARLEVEVAPAAAVEGRERVREREHRVAQGLEIERPVDRADAVGEGRRGEPLERDPGAAVLEHAAREHRRRELGADLAQRGGLAEELVARARRGALGDLHGGGGPVAGASRRQDLAEPAPSDHTLDLEPRDRRKCRRAVSGGVHGTHHTMRRRVGPEKPVAGCPISAWSKAV
ncbi:hypothetical protein PSR1_04547 [Anaeromyxobacter sp. PSR-1]|nr:hypothetical protein PSR1_04547 [Anaeromyxobacter sp. PSR-1]